MVMAKKHETGITLAGIARFVFLGILFCCLSTPAMAASLVAEVNRQEVGIGESFTLIVVADGVTGQPELGPLRVDFEVLRTSTRREVQIVNGEMSDLQSWDIELLPLRTGRIEIPALNLKGVISQPLSIDVVEREAVDTSGDERDLFIEVNIDEPSPFVQAQAVYKVRFFSALRITEAELSEPVSDKLTIRRLGEDTGFFQQRGAKRYRVIERSYAIFPKESGQIEIPPATLQLSIPDGDDPTGGFFGRVKRVTLRSPPVELNVRQKPPVPDNFPGNSAWWLPARSLDLSAAWEGNPADFRVGEPVTRVFTLDADGVVGEQLPEIELPIQEALRIYNDKPEVVEQPQSGSLLARRTEKWAVIPQADGQVELPAVEVTWFDTVAEVYRVASVAAQTLTVLPAIGTPEPEPVVANSQASTTASNDAGQQLSAGDAPVSGTRTDSVSDVAANGFTSDASETVNRASLAFWKRLAAAALAAWILTSAVAVGLWWRVRRQPRQNADSLESANKLSASKRKAMKQVHKHIKEKATPTVISASVLQWASIHWPDQPPRSLQALADRYPPEARATRNALQRLDECAYGTQASESRDNWQTLPDLLTTDLPDTSSKSGEESGTQIMQGGQQPQGAGKLLDRLPGRLSSESARELPNL